MDLKAVMYKWVVYVSVLSKSGEGANESGDDDDYDCDDDYDGRQRFRIPTATICFGTEHDDNGHK